LSNAHYKPGGGNVKILDEKVDFSYAQSKCNSKANLKHKPGGGDVQIVDTKLHFKENGRSRVNSLANAKHVPGGGNVKVSFSCFALASGCLKKRVPVFQRFVCYSLVGASLMLISSSIGWLKSHKIDYILLAFFALQIVNERLPWLKYNKPNLPPEEIAKINKHTPLGSTSSQEPIYTSRHSSTTS
uniref:Microtubule-associated protein n=1 Tax=Rodentolepis nana TaxID=102285 RepID=A0A0R3TWQ0_RODNA